MEYITRCPACAIAFQVSDDQLQLAAGKVRCGACLSIFDARSHLELPLAEQPPETTHADEEILIHDQMDSQLVDQLQEPEPEPEKPAAETATPQQPPAPLSLPAATHHLQLTHQPQQQTEQPPETVISLGCDSDGSVIELGCDNPEARQPEEEQEHRAGIDEETSAEARYEFPFDTPKPKPRHRSLWAIACLLVITLLPLLYAHFNAASLAQKTEYRSWLVSLCQVTGCHIPPQADLSKIKPSRLVVSTHPSQDNSLLVEAVIENHADFAQPLPRLLLIFSNLNGQAVSQHHFKPGEYLQGEMKTRTLFPPKRPVRIRLTLPDPGPDATNYQLLVTQ